MEISYIIHELNHVLEVELLSFDGENYQMSSGWEIFTDSILDLPDIKKSYLKEIEPKRKYELFNEIKEISPFIQGITVSGGECTLNADFLIELFKKVKNELNLTCFVDTNGGIDLTDYKELVEVADKFMLDIKSIDENEHIKVTGVSNKIVLKNSKNS